MAKCCSFDPKRSFGHSSNVMIKIKNFHHFYSRNISPISQPHSVNVAIRWYVVKVDIAFLPFVTSIKTMFRFTLKCLLFTYFVIFKIYLIAKNFTLWFFYLKWICRQQSSINSTAQLSTVSPMRYNRKVNRIIYTHIITSTKIRSSLSIMFQLKEKSLL